MKPVIGITGNYDSRDEIGLLTHTGLAGQDWDFLASDYVRAVREAGGVPVIIPQCQDPDGILPVLDRLDGLLLSGGCDVDPSFYGERPEDPGKVYFPRRDREELLLIRTAFARGLPMLGICRGLQIMAVAFGGTLYQDLPAEPLDHHAVKRLRNDCVHPVTLTAGSRLREIFGEETIGVNSFHHQAVKSVPAGAAVTAAAPDGLCEALEFSGGHPFTLAVQWHPEMMFDSPEQKKLMAAFVRASS